MFKILGEDKVRAVGRAQEVAGGVFDGVVCGGLLAGDGGGGNKKQRRSMRDRFSCSAAAPSFLSAPFHPTLTTQTQKKIKNKVMVERLAPERLGKELSLGPDAPQLAFRKLRQEWVDMGYAAPTEGDAPERRGLATDR